MFVQLGTVAAIFFALVALAPRVECKRVATFEVAKDSLEVSNSSDDGMQKPTPKTGIWFRETLGGAVCKEEDRHDPGKVVDQYQSKVQELKKLGTKMGKMKLFDPLKYLELAYRLKGFDSCFSWLTKDVSKDASDQDASLDDLRQAMRGFSDAATPALVGLKSSLIWRNHVAPRIGNCGFSPENLNLAELSPNKSDAVNQARKQLFGGNCDENMAEEYMVQLKQPSRKTVGMVWSEVLKFINTRDSTKDQKVAQLEESSRNAGQELKNGTDIIAKVEAALGLKPKSKAQIADVDSFVQEDVQEDGDVQEEIQDPDEVGDNAGTSEFSSLLGLDTSEDMGDSSGWFIMILVGLFCFLAFALCFFILVTIIVVSWFNGPYQRR